MEIIIKVEFCTNCRRADFQDGKGFLNNSILLRARLKKIRDAQVPNKEVVDILCGDCRTHLM